MPFPYHRSSAIAYRALKNLAATVALVVFSTAVFAEPWPTRYDAPSAKYSEGSFAGGFAYQSRSYTILCSERLSTGRVNEMATVAQSVRGVLESFPLELVPPFSTGGGVRDVIRIFPAHDDYLGAGGPAGSSGYFNARSREVLVSQEYLIEPKGHRSNLEPRQRYRLLVHELVHQAMAENAVLLPIWLSEGIAEYLSAAQFAPGRYRFNESSRDIVNHLRSVWLHDRRNAITLPTLESLIELDGRAWATDNRINKENAYAKYAASLLLTHYQFELAARGRGGLSEYLATMKTELEKAQSRRSRRPGRLATEQSPLWQDRSAEMVQKQLVDYWTSKGLKLTFAPLRPLDKESEHNPAPESRPQALEQ
jgi:hypothetical protein